MKAAINIKQGSIGINSVDVRRESDHALLIMVDLESKYADCFHSIGSDGEIDVWLHKTERTLHAKKGDKPSRVLIRRPDLGMDWMTEATVGRYTLVIMAVKREARLPKELAK